MSEERQRVRVAYTTETGNQPDYATSGASGVDLASSEDVIIPPHGVVSVGTGLRIEIPEGYEMQIRPRSGLAMKHAVSVLNTPGTIDADYRGEVRIILVNHGYTTFHVEKGMRIAQAVLCEVARMNLVRVNRLSETGRGAGGFGSTGV